jgi:flagellar biosynthetic protein FlhB
MAENKTEKATPKKRDDARQKGQVARSPDVNGAAVLICSLLAFMGFGPGMVRRMEEATISVLGFVKSPEIVDRRGVEELFMTVGGHVAMAAAPVVFFCALGGVVASVAQVGVKPMPKAIWQPKKLNPLTGLKHMFSPNSLIEAVKSTLKIVAVGGIVALVVFPRLQEMAALVGMPAQQLAAHLASTVMLVAKWAALAYVVIAVADFIYQRHRHDKSLRMDKDEVKQEHKQQEMSGEIRGARRRRQMEMSRGRMMDAVPTADVVVTNPTHFSVALRYDSENLAPIVVAKGADLLALHIRTQAAAHGVAVVPDPPLARALYASVDVGRMIPEELFQAVAQLLAYVYKVAGRRVAA